MPSRPRYATFPRGREGMRRYPDKLPAKSSERIVVERIVQAKTCISSSSLSYGGLSRDTSTLYFICVASL